MLYCFARLVVRINEMVRAHATFQTHRHGMKITIHFMGQLRQFAGTDQEVRDVADGASLSDVLEAAAAGHDEKFRGLLFDEDGLPRPSVLVLHGDAPVDREAPPALNDGDEITLMPPIAGG
jgi:molybdopterin converting factor small subunit